jgi:hypothetical protein
MPMTVPGDTSPMDPPELQGLRGFMSLWGDRTRSARPKASQTTRPSL